jgi:hypothetical protein
MPSFDGDSLIMTLDAPIDGVLTQDVEVSWYNAWKDWQLSSPVNRKYPPMFYDSFGGNKLTESVDAGAYFVFQNNRGWRIKPAEADHTVYVLGNVAPADATLPMAIPTDGGYTVFMPGLQPVTQNVDGIIDSQTTQVLQLAERVEGLRPHHLGHGDMYYVDPYNGSDSNDGTTKANACASGQYVHDNLVQDYNNDIINFIAGNPVGLTDLDEALLISKNNVHLRGPGQSFRIYPTTSPEDPIHITGDGCSVSSLLLRTASGGAWNALHVNGGNSPYIRDVWVEYSSASALRFNNSVNGLVEGGYLKGMASHGIDVGAGVNHLWLKPLGVHGAGGNGVHIEGAGTYEIKITGDIDIHWCSGYGIYNANNSLTRIGKDVTIESNSLGDIYDPNNKVVWEGRVSHDRLIDDIYNEPVDGAPSGSHGEMHKLVAYLGGVHLNTTNGTAGTEYPLGTSKNPVNNIADAVTIGTVLGIHVINVAEDVTVGATDNIDNFTIKGTHPTKSQITVTAGASTDFSKFYECVLTGTLDGWVDIHNCTLDDISGFQAVARNCMLNPGVITLAGTKGSHLLDCYSGVPGQSTVEINSSGVNVPIGIRGLKGGIKLTNKTGDASVSIGVSPGQIKLDSTVTNGTIVCRGVGKLTNEATGTAIIDDDGFVDGRTVAKLDFMQQWIDNKLVVEDDQVILYDDDNVTVLKTWPWDDATKTRSKAV